MIASGSVKNGYLTSVHGHTALVMEPDSDIDGSSPGSLQFVLKGVSITLLGDGASGDHLKEIAETIQF